MHEPSCNIHLLYVPAVYVDKGQHSTNIHVLLCAHHAYKDKGQHSIKIHELYTCSFTWYLPGWTLGYNIIHTFLDTFTKMYRLDTEYRFL